MSTMRGLLFGTAILFICTGGDPFEKGSPPDPHPKTFDNLGCDVIVYYCTEILYLLAIRTTEVRRLMGPCFPTGGLVCAWLFESFGVCFYVLILIQLYCLLN